MKRQFEHRHFKNALAIAATTFALAGCGSDTDINTPQEELTPVAETQLGIVRETRIVGGDEISRDDFQMRFPFLTQLAEVDDYTVLGVEGQGGFFAYGIAREPVAAIEGQLTFCSEWMSGFCPSVQGAVCVIDATDEFGFSLTFSRNDVLQALDSCAAGGAIAGAFVGDVQAFTSVSFGFRDSTAAIPAVYIPRQGETFFADFVETLLDRQVLIEKRALDPGFTCGASYLGNNWILTAAHCTRDRDISGAAVGVYSRGEALTNGLFVSSVSNGHKYPDLEAYEASIAGVGSIDNGDYALVQLESPPFGVIPVKIASPSTLQLLQESRAPVHVMGWGQTRFDSSPDKPRIATQYLVSPEECVASWSENGAIDANVHVCAIANPVTQDSCFGDSGGPLVAEVGGEIQLVGITSFGQGCADPDGAAPVYANAASIIPWIEQVTGLAVGATQELQPGDVTEIPENIDCIDTDGDGWGWNGYGPCRPPQQNPGNVQVCIDTDGDGWGWTGTMSCLVRPE